MGTVNMFVKRNELVLFFGKIFALVYFSLGPEKHCRLIGTYFWAIPFLVGYSLLVFNIFPNFNSTIKRKDIFYQFIAIICVYVKTVSCFIKRNKIRSIFMETNKTSNRITVDSYWTYLKPSLFTFSIILKFFVEVLVVGCQFGINSFKYYLLYNIHFYLNFIEQALIKNVTKEINLELSFVVEKLRNHGLIYSIEINQPFKNYVFLRKIYLAAEKHLVLLKNTERTIDAFSVPIITTLAVDFLAIVVNVHNCLSPLNKENFLMNLWITLFTLLQLIYLIKEWTSLSFKVS